MDRNRRLAIVGRIAELLVCGSLRPLTKTQVAVRVEARLTDARCDIPTRDIHEAVTRLRPAVVQTDSLGRYFPCTGFANLDDAWEMMVATEELVDLLAEADVEEEHYSAEYLYLHAIGRFKLLTPDEELSLAARAHRGDEAAARHMVHSNLRLAWSVAQRYQGRGAELLDLVQEANVGLLRAVELFDGSLGFRFSTYATWWLRQHVTRSLADTARCVRLPVHMVEQVAKLRRVEQYLEQELGRPPRDVESAAKLGVDAKRVSYLRMVSQDIASLDAPARQPSVRVDGNSREASEPLDSEDLLAAAECLGDTVEGSPAEDPLLNAEEANRKEILRNALAQLTGREQNVLELRFGLRDGKDLTLEQVGNRYGLTRERIRQIEAKALKKLRTAGEGTGVAYLAAPISSPSSDPQNYEKNQEPG